MPTIVTPANKSAILSALAATFATETQYVVTGDHSGGFEIRDLPFPQPVSFILSAATLGRISITNSPNVSFIGGKVYGRQALPLPPLSQIYSVVAHAVNSPGVRFIGLTVTGYGDGFRLERCPDAEITGCKAPEVGLNNFALIQSCDRIRINYNDVSGVAADAVHFRNCAGIERVGNTFHDNRADHASAVHPDATQYNGKNSRCTSVGNAIHAWDGQGDFICADTVSTSPYYGQSMTDAIFADYATQARYARGWSAPGPDANKTPPWPGALGLVLINGHVDTVPGAPYQSRFFYPSAATKVISPCSAAAYTDPTGVSHPEQSILATE